MDAFHITENGGPEKLVRKTHPDPTPGLGEALVRIRATSFNNRDMIVLRGGYPGAEPAKDLIPLSDGAGEVVAVGAGVTRVKPGDRVAAIFSPDWIGGPLMPDHIARSLGGGSCDGTLAELRAFPAGGLVLLPDHLSFEEGATLPCAAVTAWSALVSQSPAPLLPGETVLIQGTGGVSIFALQLAKVFGARVIATTSSADKAARLKELGADAVVDYRATPDWDKAILKLTGGRGVDLAVHVSTPDDMTKTVACTRIGGRVSLVGFLSRPENSGIDPAALRKFGVSLRAIYVGSRDDFEAMNRALATHRIRPVIHRHFAFKDTVEAYRAFGTRSHFGKVVITLP